MLNIDVRIHVKLEVKVPIEIFLDPPPKKNYLRKNLDPTKNFDSGKKF